jgi:hypothetical protein
VLAHLKEAWGQAQRSNVLLFHHDLCQSRLATQKTHVISSQPFLPRLSLTTILLSVLNTTHLAVRIHSAPHAAPLAALSCTSPRLLEPRTSAHSYITRKHAARRKRQLEEDILQRI